MNVIRKDATITNTDEEFPGSFEVILSAPTKDRDGDTLLPDEWKTPLPEKITFDADHGMSVASTVGSGTPSINAKGELVVSGTYSSLPRAQEVRTLVNEGHINTTSVAFMTEKAQQKDGKTVIRRELLNGAFVAVPSNREALVLSSKGLKAGARNSASDAEKIQRIHDLAVELGATTDSPDTSKSFRPDVKSVAGSLEAVQDRARDALNDAYGEHAWVWLRATLPDTLVFDISTEDSSDDETYQQSYTDDGSVVTLTGERTAVDLTEIVKPDPDEDASSGADNAPAAGAQAPAAGAKAAPVDNAESIAKQAQEARMRFYRTLSER